MTLLYDVFGTLFVLLGVVCVLWSAFGGLLLPGPCPVETVVSGVGNGDGLEQTVKGLLWLRGAGLWRGTVLIRDDGLDPGGLEVARILARRSGVELIQST